MSRPIQTRELQDPFVSNVKSHNTDEHYDYDNDEEPFIGSDLITEFFLTLFHFFNDSHELSKVARDDLLFLTNLPRPNTINCKKYVQNLPNVILSVGESSSIVMIDLLSQ